MSTPYQPETPQTKAEPPIGSNKCMCPTCKEWFAGEYDFDLHRAGDFNTGRFCVNPAEVGLVIREKKMGTYWGRPGSFPTETFKDA